MLIFVSPIPWKPTKTTSTPDTGWSRVVLKHKHFCKEACQQLVWVILKERQYLGDEIADHPPIINEHAGTVRVEDAGDPNLEEIVRA
jgi:hypothetical protein